MELKVDPARINGLADEVRRLEQQFGDQVTVTLKRVSELASRTSSAYSEPGVRSAISEVERRMERIRQLSREIGGELRTKEKTLRWAANEYTRQEQESFLKAKQLKLPVTLNKFAALPTTSGNKTAVLPLPFSAFSLFSRAAVYLPITVEPLAKELTLDPEHKSDEVLKLQERLQELGYELEANGYFDSATLAAVNRYKEKYGLDNTGDRQGIVDENVWRTLFGTLSGLLTVQMHGQTYSEPLKMAQLRLQELGFEVEANGYFDEATVRALEGFREVYEKDQDGLQGVIGQATWQALFNIPKVEPVEEAKHEPQYFIMADDPRSYSLDDVLNRDDPEVQERLKQTCWADLTKEEQDRIYNEQKELEKKEENEMRQKQSGIGNPFFANLMVGGSNAVVNAINTASAGLPELLAEWIMGPEPEGYVNPLDDPYGKGVGEAAGNVAGFFLPFKYVKAVKTPAALSKLSPTVVRSMTAGAIFGTATEASDAVTDFKNDGDQDLTGRAQNIALDTAMAGAGDVTFTYAFKLISSALKSTAGQKLNGWLKRSEVDEVPATQGNLETLVPSKMAEGTSNLFNTLENLGLNTPQNMVRAKKLQAVGVTEENITKVIQNEMNSSTFIQKKILNLDEFKYLNAEQRSAVISAINDGRVDISKWTGKISGELDGLTREEWLAIDKYMGNGKNVYRIPENAKEKVADFVVDEVKVEFKGLLTDTLESIESKAFKYARESFTPLPAGKNADSLVLDVSSNGQSITFEQASNIANKIKEKFPNKTIEIWTSDGDVIK